MSIFKDYEHHTHMFHVFYTLLPLFNGNGYFYIGILDRTLFFCLYVYFPFYRPIYHSLDGGGYNSQAITVYQTVFQIPFACSSS